VTAPCNGSCSCPSPCADCVHRETPWLSLSVPAYAVQEFGEEWIRARVAQHPVRVRFPAALPFVAPFKPDGELSEGRSPALEAGGGGSIPSSPAISFAPPRSADTSPTVTQAEPSRAGAEGPATGSATSSPAGRRVRGRR
jgi:hypothetical protein